jgi:GTP-binding protein
LEGTPVRIDFKTGDNPFKGRKNKLTKSQIDKRQRLKKFVKKKDKKR